MGSCYIAEAGLELLGSKDPLASASTIFRAIRNSSHFFFFFFWQEEGVGFGKDNA
jgi:hypothetical protein